MTETTIWDIDEHRGEPPGIRRLALHESLRHLESYLDGDGILEPRTVAPENGGNPLVARSGDDGFFVCGWLDVLNLAADSPLAGCEIQRIRDEDGRLFITGDRDGGTVDVEVRQLTEAGVGRLKESEDRFPLGLRGELRSRQGAVLLHIRCAARHVGRSRDGGAASLRGPLRLPAEGAAQRLAPGGVRLDGHGR